MVVLISFLLNMVASLFKSKSRLEAENAALRHQLIVVPTIGFNLLYVLVIVRLARRELVWINVTPHPTAEWIAQQITEAFPWSEAPRYLIRDQDGIYGAAVAAADEDQVVIAGLTRQLIGAAFELDELGEKTLKGIAGTVPLWRVLRERSLETRFEARGGQLTAFVGREHEVALLLERWQRVVAGEGQLVLLSGEAGIGKSRIVQTLRERLAETPHRRVHLQCSPYHTASALHPLIAHLEHTAGFVADEPIDRRLDKLE